MSQPEKAEPIQIICQHPVERLELGLLEGVPVVGPCIIDLQIGRFQALGPAERIARLSTENIQVSFSRFREIGSEERQKAVLRGL